MKELSNSSTLYYQSCIGSLNENKTALKSLKIKIHFQDHFRISCIVENNEPTRPSCFLTAYISETRKCKKQNKTKSTATFDKQIMLYDIHYTACLKLSIYIYLKNFIIMIMITYIFKKKNSFFFF